jgi:hypothetical protein
VLNDFSVALYVSALTLSEFCYGLTCRVLICYCMLICFERSGMVT